MFGGFVALCALCFVVFKSCVCASARSCCTFMYCLWARLMAIFQVATQSIRRTHQHMQTQHSAFHISNNFIYLPQPMFDICTSYFSVFLDGFFFFFVCSLLRWFLAYSIQVIRHCWPPEHTPFTESDTCKRYSSQIDRMAWFILRRQQHRRNTALHEIY